MSSVVESNTYCCLTYINVINMNLRGLDVSRTAFSSLRGDVCSCSESLLRGCVGFVSVKRLEPGNVAITMQTK